MKAEIFYYTNEIPHPAENKYWGSIYKIIHYREEPSPFSIKVGFFKRYWRKLPVKEDIHSINDFELIFKKYNLNNPYSSVDGQRIIKEYKTHTSMSIGDVIKVNNTYYMVSNLGFRKLIME